MSIIGKFMGYLKVDDFADDDETEQLLEEDEIEPLSSPIPEKTEEMIPTVTEQQQHDRANRQVYGRPAAPKERPQHHHLHGQSMKRDVGHYDRPTAPKNPPRTSLETTQEDFTPDQQAKITLKHLFIYDDVFSVTDLFLQGECVLIDFEYMQDAQARRCIDFFSGAAKVAKGSLNRIGGSMFLLAPKGAVLNLRELESTADYDYDMKRRAR